MRVRACLLADGQRRQNGLLTLRGGGGQESARKSKEKDNMGRIVATPGNPAPKMLTKKELERQRVRRAPPALPSATGPASAR